MPELSLHNIDQISRELGRQEVIFSHLLEDLIDHVCCDVEYEMQSAGLDFNAAYKKVKQKMGPRRIKEIQEETLYAVDLKYRQMKNTMKISGIAGTVMLGFAALFKIQHWPLAGILLTLGAVTLAFVFMPSALGVLWKETHSRKRIFLFISAFLTGMFFILGTLFKVQHWPAAGVMILIAAASGLFFFLPSLLAHKLQDQENKAKRPVYILAAAGAFCYAMGMFFKIMHWPLAAALMVLGLLILFLAALPLYTWITWKDEGNITPKFLYMIIGLVLILLPGALINMNLSQNYEGGFYSNQFQQKALYGYLSMKNKSLIDDWKDSSAFPQMLQINQKTEDLLALISTIEEKMISLAEGKPGYPVVITNQIVTTEKGRDIQYYNIRQPFHSVPVREFLVSGTDSRTELNLALNQYQGYILSLIPQEKLSDLTGLLDPSAYFPDKVPETGTISLMSGLHSLELLKNSLLTVESAALKTIANHK